MTRLDSRVPALRVRLANDAPVDGAGRHVLYWMIAARRTRRSFALERAAEWARALGKPLVVLEALRAGHAHANDRLHAFVADGMAENAARLAAAGAVAHPYVEPAPGQGSGLLAALAERAAVVVTDEYPTYFLPRMVAAAARALRVRLEVVDGNGLLPLRAAPRAFPLARSFRAFLQRELPRHLGDAPLDDPLGDLPPAPAGLLARDLVARWPATPLAALADPAALVRGLPIDHAVARVATRGGPSAGEAALDRFLRHKLAGYVDLRNHPDEDATSGLSPYLHFGHVSAHEVFARLVAHERWSPLRFGAVPAGSREGFWGMSAGAEAFLEQLVTWREVGFNHCLHEADDQRYESLPPWARATLDAHARDRRPVLYDRAALEAAATHDAVWNAAQTELVREGRMHNYLRMLWGKKILEWSATPRDALATMIALNDRFALDGRDPNSTSGILWCLGRYDRAWGPERPIFGTIRYMSSDATTKKLRLRGYLARFGPQRALPLRTSPH
jgi:deoxyribodipyrimidine photo-lyase